MKKEKVVFSYLFLVGIMITQPHSKTGLAQSQFDTRNDPIQIDAKEGIEWLSKEQLYIARGSASARKGSFHIKSDVIKAHYRKTENNDAEIYRLEAIRKVIIENSERTAYGDYGIYNLDTRVAVLEGKNLQLKTALETIKATKSLEYWDKKKLAIARGNAIAIRGQKTVKANIITIRFAKNANDSLSAQRMDAIGNVKISTPNEVAVGDEAIYYVEKELVRLSGNVKITRGRSQLNGSIAEVNLKTGKSRLLSNAQLDGNTKVQGLFSHNSKQTK
jgi:lipopolysaccharide export system protein LptA